MLELLGKYLAEHYWGDLASVAGILIVLLGFLITIWNVVRTKRAVEAANKAVAMIKDQLSTIDTLKELTDVIGAMDEIQRLHREKVWRILPDRYLSVTRSLIDIKTSHSSMTLDQQRTLQGAIQEFVTLKGSMESAIADGEENLDVPRVNAVVTRRANDVTKILVQIRDSLTE